MVYSRLGEVQLQADQIRRPAPENWHEAHVTLTGSNRIPFQSGDVIGLNHPSNYNYKIRTMRTNGYVVHQFGTSSASDLLLGDAIDTLNNQQPLIQFSIGKFIKFICNHGRCIFLC